MWRAHLQARFWSRSTRAEEYRRLDKSPEHPLPETWQRPESGMSGRSPGRGGLRRSAWIRLEPNLRRLDAADAMLDSRAANRPDITPRTVREEGVRFGHATGTGPAALDGRGPKQGVLR
jgi:hypothetical protein